MNLLSRLYCTYKTYPITFHMDGIQVQICKAGFFKTIETQCRVIFLDIPQEVNSLILSIRKSTLRASCDN